MENKAFFRSAFRGFNKEDVVAYIDKMSKDANRTAAEKDGEIKALTEELEQTEDRISRLVSEKEGVEKEIAEIKSDLQAKEAYIKELEEAMTASENGAEAVAVNTGLEEKIAKLQEENAVLTKKLEEYKEMDSVHHELGNIIMRAEKSASEIISKAQREADSTVAEALRRSEEELSRRMEACTRIAQSFDTGRANIDESCRTMLENLDSAKRALDMFYASLEVSSKVFKENISSVSDEISKTDINQK